MNNDRSFPTLAWLQTIAINGLLLLLYGLSIYFLISNNTTGRQGEVAAVVMIGSAVAFVFNILANFLFFLHDKITPKAVFGVLLLLQCIFFVGNFGTMVFFWGASLINYGILAVYFRRHLKKR